MAGDAFYVQTHKELLDMGLEGAALQVLQEGLAAYPDSLVLKGLLRGFGPQAGSAQLAPDNSRLPQSPLGHAEELHKDMASEDFWKELSRGGLFSLLKRRGGCVRVLDIFDADMATRTSKALEEIDEASWKLSSSGTYASTDSAKHSFFRYDGDCIHEVKHALGLLEPSLFPSFQAGKYVGNGVLEAHDDSQYFHVDMRDPNRSPRYPAGKLLFRKVALIFYLSREWCEDYGGSLVDLHEAAPQRLVPRFNSLVAFLVPRVHEVEALVPGCPPRLSVFGWLSDDMPYLPLDQLGPEHSCMDQRAQVESSGSA